MTSYKVTLQSVDVAKDSAVIEVNGKRYLVKVKDMFTNSKTGPFKLTRVGELRLRQGHRHRWSSGRMRRSSWWPRTRCSSQL